jgi:hypothetical protein
MHLTLFFPETVIVTATDAFSIRRSSNLFNALHHIVRAVRLWNYYGSYACLVKYEQLENK